MASGRYLRRRGYTWFFRFRWPRALAACQISSAVPFGRRPFAAAERPRSSSRAFPSAAVRGGACGASCPVGLPYCFADAFLDAPVFLFGFFPFAADAAVSVVFFEVFAMTSVLRPPARRRVIRGPEGRLIVPPVRATGEHGRW